MKIKTIIIMTLTVATASATVVVNDPAANANIIASKIENIKQWAKSHAQMKKLYETTQQLNKFTEGVNKQMETLNKTKGSVTDYQKILTDLKKVETSIRSLGNAKSYDDFTSKAKTLEYLLKQRQTNKYINKADLKDSTGKAIEVNHEDLQEVASKGVAIERYKKERQEMTKLINEQQDNLVKYGKELSSAKTQAEVNSIQAKMKVSSDLIDTFNKRVELSAEQIKILDSDDENKRKLALLIYRKKKAMELKIEHARRRKEREEVNAKAKESREYWKKKAKQIRR